MPRRLGRRVRRAARRNRAILFDSLRKVGSTLLKLAQHALHVSQLFGSGHLRDGLLVHSHQHPVFQTEYLALRLFGLQRSCQERRRQTQGRFTETVAIRQHQAIRQSSSCRTFFRFPRNNPRWHFRFPRNKFLSSRRSWLRHLGWGWRRDVGTRPARLDHRRSNRARRRSHHDILARYFMSTANVNADLQDWFAQGDFRANFQNRGRALAHRQAGFFQPWKVAVGGRLNQPKTCGIEVHFFCPQQTDFQPDAIPQGRLSAQFTKTYRRCIPGQEHQYRK